MEEDLAVDSVVDQEVAHRVRNLLAAYHGRQFSVEVQPQKAFLQAVE